MKGNNVLSAFRQATMPNDIRHLSMEYSFMNDNRSKEKRIIFNKMNMMRRYLIIFELLFHTGPVGIPAQKGDPDETPYGNVAITL